MKLFGRQYFWLQWLKLIRKKLSRVKDQKLSSLFWKAVNYLPRKVLKELFKSSQFCQISPRISPTLPKDWPNLELDLQQLSLMNLSVTIFLNISWTLTKLTLNLSSSTLMKFGFQIKLITRKFILIFLFPIEKKQKNKNNITLLSMYQLYLRKKMKESSLQISSLKLTVEISRIISENCGKTWEFIIPCGLILPSNGNKTLFSINLSIPTKDMKTVLSLNTRLQSKCPKEKEDFSWNQNLLSQIWSQRRLIKNIHSKFSTILKKLYPVSMKSWW